MRTVVGASSLAFVLLASCAGVTVPIQSAGVPAIAGKDLASGSVQTDQSNQVTSSKGIYHDDDGWNLHFAWEQGDNMMFGTRVLMITFRGVREGKLEGVEVVLCNPIRATCGDFSPDQIQASLDPEGSRIRIVGKGKLKGNNVSQVLGDTLAFDVVSAWPQELHAH
jgi:hypothetical protein